MKIEHEGYVLEIEEVTDYDTGKTTLYKTKCNELSYLPQGIYKTDLTNIISSFKREVNYQQKFKKEKEIPLFMQQNNSIEDKNTPMDKDVELVKNFISELDKVASEMELIEEDEYSGTILSVKLKRVYDEYKDKVNPSTSFESFIDYYSYLQTKKEEEKIKRLIIEYLGYKLDIEIKSTNPIAYPLIKGTCNALSFVKRGNYGNYSDIIDEFMKEVEKITKN